MNYIQEMRKAAARRGFKSSIVMLLIMCIIMTSLETANCEPGVDGHTRANGVIRRSRSPPIYEDLRPIFGHFRLFESTAPRPNIRITVMLEKPEKRTTKIGERKRSSMETVEAFMPMERLHNPKTHRYLSRNEVAKEAEQAKQHANDRDSVDSSIDASENQGRVSDATRQQELQQQQSNDSLFAANKSTNSMREQPEYSLQFGKCPLC